MKSLHLTMFVCWSLLGTGITGRSRTLAFCLGEKNPFKEQLSSTLHLETQQMSVVSKQGLYTHEAQEETQTWMKLIQVDNESTWQWRRTKEDKLANPQEQKTPVFYLEVMKRLDFTSLSC